MAITEQFRDEIENFLSTTGMDPTRFGRAVMNDPNFVFDLREKRSPTAATMDKVRVWMTAHLENNEAEPATSPDTGTDTGTGSLRLSQQHLLGIEDRLCLESGGNWFWRLSERAEFCGGQAARSRVSSAIS